MSPERSVTYVSAAPKPEFLGACVGSDDSSDSPSSSWLHETTPPERDIAMGKSRFGSLLKEAWEAECGRHAGDTEVVYLSLWYLQPSMPT
jgi:hypothetical protein